MNKAYLWIGFILLSFAALFFKAPKINFDILELLSDSRFELVSKSLKNNTARVLIHGDKDVLNAALNFKQNTALKLKTIANYQDFFTSPAHLLSDSQLTMLEQPNSVAEISKQILTKLTSPLSGFYSQFLEVDPLLLLQDRILEFNKNLGFKTEQGVLLKDNQTALILVELPKQIARVEQSQTVDKIESELRTLRKLYPDLDIRWSGMLRFANSSALKMERDLNIISSIGSVLTGFVVIYCFRSALPFFLCFLAVAVGMLGGTVFVSCWKGSLHMLTLGFGCSLLGACVDYPIHYFCAKRLKKQHQNDENVMVPISLGALTTALAFCSLAFSGFTGLVEISLFSLGSVFASWLTVYCLFPVFKSDALSKDPFFSLCHRLSSLISSNKKTLYLILFVLFVFGLLKLKFNDDIRLLQPADPNLIADEKWIQEQTNSGLSSGVVFVSGKDEKDLNANLERANSELLKLEQEGEIANAEGKLSFLPAVNQQEQSAIRYQKFLEKNRLELISALEKIGYEQRLIDKVFVIGKPQDFLADEFNIGKVQERYWSFIQIFGAKNTKLLRSTFSENAFFYEHAFEISKIFKNYRQRSLMLVVLSYFIIFLSFCWRYGFSLGWRNFLPAVLSALLSVSFLAIIGFELNFFSLLALVIVLGLTIDYSIFYLEGQEREIPTSIFLSSLTTIITFGLLAFSSTPVLASFGILVATGIIFALVLTYLPFSKEIK